MIPVKQRNRHDPAAGVWGDCHRAAVATMLSLPLDAVPHFGDGGPTGDVFKALEKAFLASHGLVPIDAVYAGGEADVQLILHVVSAMNPDVPFLLGGTSRNGVDHTVVCLNDAIVHDPSLDDSGIVGPCKDGWYWVTFFGARNLDARPKCPFCGATMKHDESWLCSRCACPNAD